MLVLFLMAKAHAAPEIDRTQNFVNLAGYSTGQTEVGFVNLFGPLGHPLPDGFYAKGKYVNFMFIHGEHGEPKAASYEALFPGILLFLVFFTESPEDSGFPWYALVLLNGEFGFRKGPFSLGFVNGIHPFFTRAPYHDAGARLGIGKSVEFGVSVYEQDRMFSGIDYGVRADLQAFTGF